MTWRAVTIDQLQIGDTVRVICAYPDGRFTVGQVIESTWPDNPDYDGWIFIHGQTNTGTTPIHFGPTGINPDTIAVIERDEE